MGIYNQNLIPKYYNIDDFKIEEDSLKLQFKELVRGTKLYFKINPNKTSDFPIFATKFLLENGHCTIKQKCSINTNSMNGVGNCNNDYESLKDELRADPEIVNLRNKYFYLKNLLVKYQVNNINSLNNNKAKLKSSGNDEMSYNNVDNEDIVKDIKSIFFQRVGNFSKFLLKKDFSVEDVAKMSIEEKNIVIKGRKRFIQFN